MTTGTIDTTALPLHRSFKHWEGSDNKYVPGTNILKWNPYLMEAQHYDLTRTTGEYSRFGFIMSPIIGMIKYDNNLEIKSLNKIVAKAKGHSFNLAVASAESSRSVRLVKDTLFSVGRAAIDIHNGRINSAAERLMTAWRQRSAQGRKIQGMKEAFKRLSSGRVLKPIRSQADAAQAWLELQYGWKPLLSDVYEAMSLLHKRQMRRKPIELSALSERRYELDIGSPAEYKIPISVHEICKMKYRYYEPVIDSTASLGLEDPATVAWEMLPFSFVADWFIPIGSYLTAANQVPLLLGELLVTKYRRSSSVGQATALISQYDGCTVDYNDVNFVRNVYADGRSYRVPLPEIKSLKDALSPLHIVNATALLSSILSSDPKTSRVKARSF